VIDKPKGLTSHDVVQVVKRAISAKKVGHLGTLDPAATGVLPLVINGATKQASRLAGVEKVYRFTLVLGASTDTDDDMGRVIFDGDCPEDCASKVKDLIPTFVGDIEQIPPHFSAIKVGGRRAYKIARNGKKPKIGPRRVYIKNLYITNSCDDKLEMVLECNSGTYVRSICRDIGKVLGCGGYASNIRRLLSGRYSIEQAIPLDDFMRDSDDHMKYIIPI